MFNVGGYFLVKWVCIFVCIGDWCVLVFLWLVVLFNVDCCWDLVLLDWEFCFDFVFFDEVRKLGVLFFML